MISPLQLPPSGTLSRRVIIREYQTILLHPPSENPAVVRIIAERLGYTIDKNRSNDFVRRVIREYLMYLEQSGAPHFDGTSRTTTPHEEVGDDPHGDHA